MIIQSLSSMVLFVTVIIAVLIAVIIVFFGKRLAGQNRRFVGTASPVRVSLEVGCFNLVLLVPYILLIVLLALDSLPAKTAQIANILSLILSGLSLAILPLWAAIRLDLPAAITPSAYVATYRRAVIGLAITVFGTSAFSCLLLPLPIIYVLKPGSEFQPVTEFLLLAATLTVAFTIVFIFMRGMMELVRFTLYRRHEPQPYLKEPFAIYRLYRFLFFFIVVALVLWAISYVLYSNSSSHPDWVYIPPIYLDPPFPSNLLLPTDRSPALMFAIAAPPVVILLIGWFIVRRRIPEQATFLFGVLCLLYGLWGLDIFLRLGGPIFWAVRVLAWLFITPVQLHFALVFPHQEETITEDMRSLWAWVQQALYGSFVLLIPFWLYFNLHTVREIETLMLSHGYLTPLVWLWGAVGSLSLLLAWIISGYILWHTWRDLGEAYQHFQFQPSSGCLWIDIVERREQNHMPLRIARGKQQLKWVALGALGAGTSFIVWTLLLFPVVIPNMGSWGAWSDAAVRFGFLLVFICVLIAIRQYRLWDIDRILVDAFGWSLLVTILSASYTWLESQLESVLIRTLGLLTFLILSKISIDHWLSPMFYRLAWNDKCRFQEKLKTIRNQFRAAQVGPYGTTGSLRFLTEACPEKASAVWLLTPSGNPNDQSYSIHNICHSPIVRDISF